MSDQVRSPPARPGEPPAEGKERRRGAARPRGAAAELPGRPLRTAGPGDSCGGAPLSAPGLLLGWGRDSPGSGAPLRSSRFLSFSASRPCGRTLLPWSWPGLPAPPSPGERKRKGKNPSLPRSALPTSKLQSSSGTLSCPLFSCLAVLLPVATSQAGTRVVARTASSCLAWHGTHTALCCIYGFRLCGLLVES